MELVDDAGIAVGSCSVAEAHTAPGRRHRAFSVMLNDGAGRVLLQQRAAGKTRFPNRWSNTCCGHQEPGQDTAEAALARLIDELGITPGQLTPLAEAGAFHYHATDPGTGRVEDEWDHVLVATLAAGVPVPAAAEVSDCRWTDTAVLRAALRADPDGYTPWLTRVLDIAERSTTYDR